MTSPPRSLTVLERRIIDCDQCTRLRSWCKHVAATKRPMYRHDTYWGRPVPGFGDPRARLLVLGLAPAAHGANRTGRVFTGDRSGDWLFRALHEAGFASQPQSTHRDDGLTLKDCWVSASVRCAPPDNKPVPEEIDACRPFLLYELRLLPSLKVIVALGRLAWANLLSIYNLAPRSSFAFSHLATIPPTPSRPTIIGSYHPSQQNTQTGRLTRQMLQSVFTSAGRILEAS